MMENFECLFLMSFPYGQYPSEDLSNPTTPLTFPPWETTSMENEPQGQPQAQAQQHQQQQLERQHQQQQQNVLQQRHSHSPEERSPITPHNPVQRLEDPLRAVPSQSISGFDDTPIRLHHVPQRHESHRESLRDAEHRSLHVETRSNTAPTSTAGPSRQTRVSLRTHQQQAHPYRRPPSAVSSAPPTRQQPTAVRFSSVQPSAHVVPSMQASSSVMHSPSVPLASMPSPAVPSPASIASRIPGYTSTIGSPMDSMTMLPPSTSRDKSVEPRRKWMLRSDSWYDPEAKKLRVMLEVPGVSKADVRVSLSTCSWNRVKQISVLGVSRPVFPPLSAAETADGMMLDLTTVRERRFGEFARTFAVPAETNIQLPIQILIQFLDKLHTSSHGLDNSMALLIPCESIKSGLKATSVYFVPMVDDKYIGIALAISGSVLIGTSFIITKKVLSFTNGLNDTAKRNAAYGAQSATDSLSYLKNPIWWAGLSTIANFAAYAFAPPILVTPLGALSVLIGAVLASFFLNEELGHLGRLGCALCFIGSLIIVLHAPEDKEILTVDEYLTYVLRPGFLLYCLTVLVFTLIMIYAVAPKYGRSNPLIYISICSLVGSVSVMAIKGFGVAVKLTFGGQNQFTHVATYVLGIFVALCILVQMNYFNKALDTFSTNVVNPMYFVGFTSATITASLILFQGFNTTGATNTVSLLCGFTVTFLGVHLLNISRTTEPALGEHSALEGGLLNPRLSLQGRPSLDGWNGDSRIGPAPRGQVRRGSHYRSNSGTLFNAFGEYEGSSEAVGLEQLREEESEDDENANERTLLKGGSKQQLNGRANGSRSQSHSPIPSRSGSMDARIVLP
ncbi:hypothetical protein H0H93_009706 [Arthromyces matolae]|nr:hypothetical protein H0H93_009706 [Arthromyces matolae]